jgi:hypothetical protein
MELEKTMEFLLDQQAHFNENMARLSQYQIDAEERYAHEMAAARADMASVRAELRRGVHMAVEEARREREQRRQLAEAQRLTEEKLQRLIDRLGR